MSFTALAMPCTQAQFEQDLEPTLKRWGVKIDALMPFGEYCYIVNNYRGQNKNVSNLQETYIEGFDRTPIPYNPAKFLDSLFPEKWCVRGSKEFRELLYRLKISQRSWDGDDKLAYYFLSNNQLESNGYDIPTDYTEVTLEELVYHYEQPKEEVMKEERPNITFDPFEEPEWDSKTRCGLDVVIFETSDKIYGKVLEHNTWTAKDWDLKGSYEYGRFQSRYDLIPFNPRIAELKARKEELEAELEGINKELNR